MHIAIVEFHMDQARLDEARAVMTGLLETSAAYPGCDHLEWLVDRDDPAHWTLYETWASWEDEQAYRDFRAGEGRVPELGPLLAAPPALVRYEAHSA